MSDISAHDSKTDAGPHPCLSCGACCACFRVSFYWAEAEARGLPQEMVEQITPWMACMAGTGAHPVRCIALEGEPGLRVSCRVYEQRPSPCRSVQPGDEQCRTARARHGLAPLATDCLI